MVPVPTKSTVWDGRHAKMRKLLTDVTLPEQQSHHCMPYFMRKVLIQRYGLRCCQTISGAQVEEGKKGFLDDDVDILQSWRNGGTTRCGMEVMKVVIKDITVAVEEITAGMVAVVNDATPTEDAGAAVVLQKQMHTNKPKPTTDRDILLPT
ncbi:hypothetical protein Tco_1091071, partial [Tanacetum coccineum]